uniref:Uncharacterized protein n=1 Tax=Loa loa TaxID=7209 RepID=A0A1I7VDD3_LOALO
MSSSQHTALDRKDYLHCTVQYSNVLEIVLDTGSSRKVCIYKSKETVAFWDFDSSSVRVEEQLRIVIVHLHFRSACISARTCTASHDTQHQSTQAGHTLLGADSPTGVHGGRASLGSIIRGTKGHLFSILGSVTQGGSTYQGEEVHNGRIECKLTGPLCKMLPAQPAELHIFQLDIDLRHIDRLGQEQTMLEQAEKEGKR